MYFVEICMGDCEFFSEFTLEFTSYSDASLFLAISEKANNFISGDIKESK